MSRSQSTLAASFSALHRTNTFTSRLPSDPRFPTPKASHDAPRGALLPRLVQDALFTYVRPMSVPDPELLVVSQAALKDLGLDPSIVTSPDFLPVLSGNRILGWEDVKDGGEGPDLADKASQASQSGVSAVDLGLAKDEARQQQESGRIYPWAQCYGGFQFGSWAGQLGDGRAHSLFETINPATNKRYEVQLKGAGKTPYSRFADGRAVLRSSIREFIVSEALNALGIPTTRALALVLNEQVRVQRERMEPSAIVCRFAESWIRLGSFDLLRARGKRHMIRQLADYVAEEVLGGYEALAAALPEREESRLHGTEQTQASQPYSHLPSEQLLDPGLGLKKDEIQGSGPLAQNRYARIYRTVVRSLAMTTAKWQVYGFTNGVLNTDNISILGLSLDFGPFSFMDIYDPDFTPNHDDEALRYSYGNQPGVIWWNLLRFGEALGELIGGGARVDESRLINGDLEDKDVKEIQSRAETLIMRAGEEYKAVLRAEYSRGMARRLGLKSVTKTDFDDLFTPWLDLLQELEIDFNQAFYRLAGITLSDLGSNSIRQEQAEVFFAKDAKPLLGMDVAKHKIAAWLESYYARISAEWDESSDEERRTVMKAANPKFLPRNWILEEVIEKVERKGERRILQHVLNMALHPFNEDWGGDREEEERFCGHVPQYKAQLQCSCSS